MNKKLQISRKDNLKGEDGYRTFSVRIKESTVMQLDALADETGRSRNELANLLIDYGLANTEVSE